MKHSLSVLSRNLFVACFGVPTLSRRVSHAFPTVFVMFGALACLWAADGKSQGDPQELIRPYSVADREAGKLLTALADSAAPVASPIRDVALSSMDTPAPAAETGAAAPSPAEQDSGEVDELDLFLLELAEGEAAESSAGGNARGTESEAVREGPAEKKAAEPEVAAPNDDDAVASPIRDVGPTDDLYWTGRDDTWTLKSDDKDWSKTGSGGNGEESYPNNTKGARWTGKTIFGQLSGDALKKNAQTHKYKKLNEGEKEKEFTDTYYPVYFDSEGSNGGIILGDMKIEAPNAQKPEEYYWFMQECSRDTSNFCKPSHGPDEDKLCIGGYTFDVGKNHTLTLDAQRVRFNGNVQIYCYVRDGVQGENGKTDQELIVGDGVIFHQPLFATDYAKYYDKDGTEGFDGKLTIWNADTHVDDVYSGLSPEQQQEEGRHYEWQRSVVMREGGHIKWLHVEETEGGLLYIGKPGEEGETHDGTVKLEVDKLTGGSHRECISGDTLVLHNHENGGHFRGHIASNFVYDDDSTVEVNGEKKPFVLDSVFQGNDLVVKSGKLTLAQGVETGTGGNFFHDVNVSIEPGGELFVEQGEVTFKMLDDRDDAGDAIPGSGTLKLLEDSILVVGDKDKTSKFSGNLWAYKRGDDSHSEHEGTFTFTLRLAGDFIYAGADGEDSDDVGQLDVQDNTLTLESDMDITDLEKTAEGTVRGKNSKRLKLKNQGEVTSKTKIQADFELSGTKSVTLKGKFGTDSVGNQIDVKEFTGGKLTLAAGGGISELQAAGTQSGKVAMELNDDTSIHGMDSGSLSGLILDGKLQPADPLTLTLGGDEFNFGQLTLEKDAELAFDMHGVAGQGKSLEGTRIEISGIADGTGQLDIQMKQDYLGLLKTHGGQYNLFDFTAGDGGKEGSLDGFLGRVHLHKDGLVLDEGYTLWLDSRGIIHYISIGPELTWSAKDDFYWRESERDDENDWYANFHYDEDHLVMYGNDQNVHFDTVGKDKPDVQYSGELVVNDMEVEDVAYSFTPEDTKDGTKTSLLIKKALHVTSEATFTGGTVSANRLTGSGEVVVTGKKGEEGSFTVEGALGDAFDGSLHVGGGKGTGEATVTLKEGGRLPVLRMDEGGTLVIGDGTAQDKTLLVEELSGAGGRITGGQLYLTAKGYFGGDIDSEMTYEGGEFTLAGAYTASKNLTVRSGELTLTGRNGAELGTLTLSGKVTVGRDAGLVLGDGSGITDVTLSGGDKLVLEEFANVEMLGTSKNLITGGVTLKNGTTLTMSGGQDQQIDGGLEFQAGAHLQWDGTLTVHGLSGNGTLSSGNKMVITGDNGVKSNYTGLLNVGELEVSGTGHQLSGGFGGKLTLKGGAGLTLDGAVIVATGVDLGQGSELTVTSRGTVSELRGAGTLTVGDGKKAANVTLTTDGERYTGTLDVEKDSTVTADADITVGHLTGAGEVTGGHTVTVTAANGEFGGRFLNHTGLTLKGSKAGLTDNTLTLTQGQEELGAVSVGDHAKLTFSGAENKADSVELGKDASSVTLGGGVTLETGNLSGGGTVSGGEDSNLLLTYENRRRKGEYSGTLGVDLEYVGIGEYELKGDFTGEKLIVSNDGKLDVDRGVGQLRGEGTEVWLYRGVLELGARSHISALRGVEYAAAGTLVMNAGGAIDKMDGAGLVGLEVGETLTLQEGDYRFGSVTLHQGGATLEFALEGAEQGTRVHLNSMNGITGGTTLTLQLTEEMIAKLVELGEYHLFFEENGIGSWNDEVLISDANGNDANEALDEGRIYLDEDGYLRYDRTGAIGDLTWTGNDPEWKWDTDANDWCLDYAGGTFDGYRRTNFTNEANVNFVDDNLLDDKANNAVRLSGEIKVNAMRVKAGSYTFGGKSGVGGRDTLRAKRMEIYAGAAATFGLTTHVTGKLSNNGTLTVTGAGGEVEAATLVGGGGITVSGGGRLTVNGAMTAGDATNGYTGVLTLNGGTVTANGTLGHLNVEAGGGRLNANGQGQMTAELMSGETAGELTLSGVYDATGKSTVAGEFDLSGRTAGAVKLATDGETELRAHELGVGGLSGGGDNTTLSGTVTVTGVGKATTTYAGNIRELNLTMTGGRQEFAKAGQTLETARVEGGRLTLADKTTVGDLTVNGNVVGKGDLTAPSLQGTGIQATVNVAGKLTLTGASSQYAGSVTASELNIQRGTHTFGNAKVNAALTLGHRSHLHVDNTLTLTGEVNMTLSGAYRGTPYMSAVGTGTLQLGNGPVTLNFSLPGGVTWEGLEYGTYYLISEEELSGNLDRNNPGKNFKISEAGKQGLDAWAAAMEKLDTEGEFTYGWKLEVVEDGHSLVLNLSRDFDTGSLASDDDLVWYGDWLPEEDIWRGNLGGNWWPKNDGTKAKLPPDGRNLYFVGYDEGNVSDYRVHVQGAVAPASVHAVGGKYTFEGDGKGIDMEKGEFEVNGGIIHMQMGNTRIPAIDLKGGAFHIEHEAAIPGQTKVNLSGGLLGFGEKATEAQGGGELYRNGDAWKTPEEAAGHLFLAAGRLRVQAGMTYAEFMNYVKEQGGDVNGAGYRYEAPTDDINKDLRIGSEKTRQQVVTDALSNGVEKTGRFGMTLQWNAGAGATDVTGAIDVKEGRLTLRSYGTGKMTLRGALNIAHGGTLHLYGSGEVEVQSAFKDTEAAPRAEKWLGDKFESRVVLGYENDGATYQVNGDNHEYDGTIVLRGNGTGDRATAVFRSAEAAGHAETAPVTKLELRGRALTFDRNAAHGAEGGSLKVHAEEIKVVKDTVNLVGGYTGVDGQNNPNAKVWLSGPLTGEGVLANAYATKAAAFHHAYTGALKGFRGTIAAGLLSTAPQTRAADGAGESDSTWTLVLEDATKDGETYDFRMAGTGEIQLRAGVDITLTGAVGDTANGYGNTVDLTNIGKHDITLAGKSTTTGALITNKDDTGSGNFILDGKGAEWAGTVLQGGGSFTLTEGTLTDGKNFEKPRNNSELTVNAKGTVDVGGMDVDKSGMGDITIVGTTRGKTEAEERHGRLVGVDSDIDTEKRRVTLVFDEYNFNNPEAMIEFKKGTKHSLKVTQNAEDKESPDTGLVLDFTAAGLVNLLKTHNKENGNVTDLQIVGNGGTLTGIAKGSDGAIHEETFDGGHLLRLLTEGKGYGSLLYELGFTLNARKVDEGILSLSGTSKDVYLVLTDEGEEGGDYGSRPHDLYVGLYEGAKGGVAEKSKSVVVDQGETFTVHFGKKAGADAMLDEVNGTVHTDLTLRNLIGLEGSALEVKDERENKTGRVSVNLVNETAGSGNMDDTAYGPDYKPVEDGDHTVRDGQTDRKDGFNVRGQDTTFEGTIIGDATVDFVKQGAGQLTVGSATTGKGGLNVKGGLRLEDGGVTLQGGESNALGTLTFGYGTEGDKRAEDNTGLTLARGVGLTVNDILERGTGERTGGDITLGEKSVLTFDNSGRADKSVGATLKDTRVRAAAEEGGEEDEEGRKAVGTFRVKGQGTSLTLTGASAVEGVNVTVGEKKKEEEQKDAAKAASEDAEAVPDGLLTVQGDAKVDTAGTLTVQGDGKVDLQGSTENKVGRLVGDGTLSGESGARLTVTGSDSDFTGTLASAEQQRGSATLGVVDGAVLNLKDVITDPARAWNLDIVKGGSMVLGKTEASRMETMMRFGDIDVQGGGNLTIDGVGKSFIAGDVWVDKSNGEKMDFTVGYNKEKDRIWLDLTFNEKGGKELDNPDSKNAKNVEDFVDLGLTGHGSSHYRGYLRRDWDPQDTKEHWEGQWYIGLEKRLDNPFYTPGDHKNVHAGEDLAYDADDPDSEAFKYLETPEGQAGDLAHAVGAVKEAEHPDRLFAALAGSSISTLSAAMLEDVRRQLESLRSRAAMLSNSEPKGNLETDRNKWQAWLNAETGYHKLDHESWGPGYRLQGWGGTVGGGYELSPRTTLGLAVTAMYNDIEADAADFAEGDLDFVYLSTFMRTHLGRWTHTLLSAIGAVDVSLDRTVSYETAEYAGSYKTFGSSRGLAMGFVYELAYNKKLNESGTLVVQPLFNMEYRHANVNAYTEKGSDAGLYVNEVKTNLITLGLGSRMQGVISEDAFGHTAVFEGRALVKMDTGHNTGRANVRFKHGNLSREIESAPTGIFGVEIGAGCTVSLGIRGVVFFLDGSAEFREHYTNLNASAGYRISF